MLYWVHRGFFIYFIQRSISMSPRKAVPKQGTAGEESVLQSIQDILAVLLNLLLYIYIFLLLAVMPFYHTQGYLRIGTDKATFFLWTGTNLLKLIMPLAVGCLLLECLIQRREQQSWKLAAVSICRKLCITDCFALLYGISVVISYLFSDYRESTFWGANGWYMGMVTQLCLVALYFLIAKGWRKHRWLFYIMLPVSFTVFLLGIINRFGFFPLNMNLKDGSFISTIGNINWYCGYLVITFFTGLGLLWQGAGNKKWQRALLICYCFAGFASLVTQGSASGILTLVLILMVLFWLSAKEQQQMEYFWQGAALLSAACLLMALLRIVLPNRINYTDSLMDLLTYSTLPVIMTIVSFCFYAAVQKAGKAGRYPKSLFLILSRLVIALAAVLLFVYLSVTLFHTLYPEKLAVLSGQGAFTFNYSWGSHRGATLAAGWKCFREQDFLHKLVGIGPDGMSAYIEGAGSEELKAIVAKNFGAGVRLTNAHSEWFTILINTGILGLVSYGGMIATGIFRFLKRRNGHMITAACGLGLLAYTCNNIFSFQQAMSVGTVFVLFGIGAAFAEEAPAA